MMKKIYCVLFVAILVFGLIGCQLEDTTPTIPTAPSETDGHTDPSEATQVTMSADEQFSEALYDATSVCIYLLCPEGDETITFEVDEKVVSMSSMKQIEKLEDGAELDGLKALFKGWLPSVNEMEGTDTVDTIYVVFNTGLLISWGSGNNFGRINLKQQYHLPAAFVEYINGLCDSLQS